MLFNSIEFIFYFMPLALVGYYALGAMSTSAARVWLFAASMCFYGFWDPRYLLLLIASMIFNYAMGRWIQQKGSLLALWIGLLVNLLVLFHFKYVFNLVQFFNLMHVTSVRIDEIVLPLGISFFTFTQIGYLVDSQAGLVEDTKPLDYLNFVTFFPHLIAGPILHHREMMPQLKRVDTYQLKADNLSIGLTVFTAGLAKKVLIADRFAPMAEQGFANAHGLGGGDAWLAVLSYSLQLYFDFSAYSDMAVGVAKMFGIGFPLNFNSPYKATNLIEFWQRWHMTLTRYLTLYIFNPIVLSLTRRRLSRRLPIGNAGLRTPLGFIQLIAIPLFVTMGLAGVWHGAGLQFLVFGLLHAAYLTVNHAWRAFGPKAGERPAWLPQLAVTGLSVLATFLAVLVGQVFFRADSVGDALAVLGAMLGFESGPARLGSLHAWLRDHAAQIVQLAAGFALVWGAPNIYNLLGAYSPALTKVPAFHWAWLRWRPTPQWAFGIAALFFLAVVFLQNTSRFLYFQF